MSEGPVPEGNATFHHTAFPDDPFLEAAAFKIAAARFHWERLKVSIGHPSWRTREVLKDDPALALAVGADFAALMIQLHTVQDTLAQFVNKAIGAGLDEDQVTLGRLLGKVPGRQVPDRVYGALQALQDRTQYVVAFANFSKHHRVIMVVDVWNVATGAPHTIMVPQTFSWKGRTYSAGGVIWVADRDIIATQECAHTVIDTVAASLT